MMKKLLALLTCAALLFAFTACGGSGSSSEAAPAADDAPASQAEGSAAEETPAEEVNTDDLPVLRVAMMPYVTSLPTYYIIENGLDVAAGFKIEHTMFQTGAPMSEALAADLWDVGAMGAAAVTGVANYDMMIVGEVLDSTDGLAVFVEPDSAIAGVKGYNPSFPDVLGDPDTVKGTTILLPVGTAQHFTALKWLEKLGLQSTDVNIVNMDTAQAYQAFQSQQGEVVSLNIPTFFDAIDDGKVQAGNLAKMGTMYVDMIVGNRKAVEEKPELVQQYVDLVMEVCEKFNDDKDMAADLMLEYSTGEGIETTLEACKGDLERIDFVTTAKWQDGRTLGTFAKELGEFYISLGQLEPDLMDKFETNIDDQFVKQ